MIPICFAQQDFSNYKNLDLKFLISSELDISYTGSSPKIDYIIADLEFFPRETYRQEILDFDTNSEPDAEISKGDFIRYEWKNPNEQKIRFGLNSKIRTENEFKRITKKVSFPILDLDDKFSDYTKATEYTDINQDIKNKANEIVAGETDLYEAVFKLADWTKSNIEYDLNTLTEDVVQKSTWVLRYKEGVCDEITNLFISFLRSIGVPARFVSGVVYSNVADDFGNHGWAEVYFPGYGWVPFDVTFGQYGWLDPSHLKLKDSLDSGSPSAEYSWRSRDVSIEPKDLDIKTTLIKKGSKVESPIKITIEPLKKEVSFGSYVPLQVTVENLRNYYVSSNIFITKAPELIEKNVKQILLKPGQIKNIYWILKIPDNLEEGYLYSSVIVVNSSFGATDSSVVKYSANFDYNSLAQANERIKKLEEREEKIFFPNLELNCKADKTDYYSNEKAKIFCSLRNEGNINLEDLKVCLKEDCRKFDLSIAQKKDISFDDLELSKSEKIAVVAENEDMVKYDYIDLKVIVIPKLLISDLKPTKVSYKDIVNLSFFLSTNTKVSDVNVEIRNIGDLKIPEFSDSQEINIQTTGSSLVGGLKFNLNYKDEKGKLYEKDEKFLIKVENVPWYARMFSWFSRIF